LSDEGADTIPYTRRVSAASEVLLGATESVQPNMNRRATEPGRLHKKIPWVALGIFPDVEHADLGTIPLGNLDPPRDRHPLCLLKLLDEPGDGLTVRTFYKDPMVTGDPDRAAVARPHLEVRLAF
jgi:hypothetical protein